MVQDTEVNRRALEDQADELETQLRQQTEDILAASKRLIEEMNELRERARALKAAHDVLLASARQEREITAVEKKKRD